MYVYPKLVKIYNASSMIYSYFTDLHKILYTFQQHPVHLDKCSRISLYLFRCSLIKQRKYSVSEFRKAILHQQIEILRIILLHRNRDVRKTSVLLHQNCNHGTQYHLNNRCSGEREVQRGMRGGSSFDCGLRVTQSNKDGLEKCTRCVCADFIAGLQRRLHLNVWSNKFQQLFVA